MSMMEEGDEALGLDRTICRLSEQAGMWVDSVDRTITEPVHVDKLARMTAAMEGIEREANAKACFLAAHRAMVAAAVIPFCLDVNCPVGFDRTSRACG
jgi:hypothetical protein